MDPSLGFLEDGFNPTAQAARSAQMGLQQQAFGASSGLLHLHHMQFVHPDMMQQQYMQQQQHHLQQGGGGAVPGPPPSAAAPADLHRLKICGVPAGTFTDAKLRQLFELCGKVRCWLLRVAWGWEEWRLSTQGLSAVHRQS